MVNLSGDLLTASTKITTGMGKMKKQTTDQVGYCCTDIYCDYCHGTGFSQDVF